MPQYLPRKLKQNQRSETHCPILPRTQPEMESLAKTGPIPNHNAIKPRKAHSNKKEKEIAQPHSTKEHGITRSGRRNPNDSFARAVWRERESERARERSDEREREAQKEVRARHYNKGRWHIRHRTSMHLRKSHWASNSSPRRNGEFIYHTDT